MKNENLVAIYVRVSTEDQVAGHSLAAQENTLRSEAQMKGRGVYRVYQDAGVSGVDENRSALNALLRDAERGCFAEVMVWSVSRISRKLSHLLEIIEKLKMLGIAFRSICEQFDVTTPMGQFALTMMGAVAQMQRESWIESSRIGMKRRAVSGRWGGGMMLGYRMITDEDCARGSGRLVVEANEAATVLRIFTLYASGFGYKAIVNRINEQGLLGKNGRPFSINTIKTILANSVYAGKTRFGEDYYDGIHEAIISEELWQQVQQKIAANSKAVAKKIEYEYLLSGLLKCPVCGSGMLPSHAKNKRKSGLIRYYYYYSCGSYLNHGKIFCKANSVPADKADEKVMFWLQEFLSSPFWLKQVSEMILQRYEKESRENAECLAKIEAGLRRIGQKQMDLLGRYENGVLEKDMFLEEMKRLKEEKDRWLSKEDDSQEKKKSDECWSNNDIKAAFQSFRQILNDAPTNQKKLLLRNLISSVRVNENRQVTELELKLIPSFVQNGEVSGQLIRIAI